MNGLARLEMAKQVLLTEWSVPPSILTTEGSNEQASHANSDSRRVNIGEMACHAYEIIHQVSASQVPKQLVEQHT
jgi:hypothetical protein